MKHQLNWYRILASRRADALIAACLVVASLLLASCASFRCYESTDEELLELHYVYDPYGGSPIITTVVFLGCGTVRLETAGLKAKTRRLGAEKAASLRQILEDPIFRQQLANLEAEPGETKGHGSFVAVATRESRVPGALPPVQLEPREIPPEMRDSLVELEQLALSVFKGSSDGLRPGIGHSEANVGLSDE